LTPDFELVELLVADVEGNVLHDEQDHRSGEDGRLDGLFWSIGQYVKIPTKK